MFETSIKLILSYLNLTLNKLKISYLDILFIRIFNYFLFYNLILLFANIII